LCEHSEGTRHSLDDDDSPDEVIHAGDSWSVWPPSPDDIVEVPEGSWSPAVVMVDLDEVRNLDHHLQVAMNACRQRGRDRTVEVLDQLLTKVRPTPPTLPTPEPAESSGAVFEWIVAEHGGVPQWSVTVPDLKPAMERLRRDVDEALERALRGWGARP
jgi:hypothetical protein